MEIDGLLVVDKPEGIPSFGVVKEIKRRFSQRKVGHIGTLDPFATGVLPIALNEATKLIPFLRDEPKEYEGLMKLGEETTTDDLTGEVSSRGSWEDVSLSRIDEAFQRFLGTREQIPPMFSAIKVNGQSLYRLARKGVELERKGRRVRIFKIEVQSVALPHIHFRVSCSRGTYIRSLAREIGREIGCGAHLVRLRRVRSGSFTLEQALSWGQLKELSDPRDLGPWIIPLEEAVDHLPEMVGDEELAKKTRSGQKVMVRDLAFQSLPPFEKGEWIKFTSSGNGLVAILRSEMRAQEVQRMDPDTVVFRPLRVFRTLQRIHHERDA